MSEAPQTPQEQQGPPKPHGRGGRRGHCGSHERSPSSEGQEGPRRHHGRHGHHGSHGCSPSPALEGQEEPRRHHGRHKHHGSHEHSPSPALEGEEAPRRHHGHHGHHGSHGRSPSPALEGQQEPRGPGHRGGPHHGGPHGRRGRPQTTASDWERSDQFHNSHLLRKDEALDAAIQNSEANGLPPISVSPAQGQLLYLLAKSIGAKRILEVGTLGGYSTIHLARALPDDGKVITLELDEHHAKVATENITKAGLASKVDIILGPALDSLEKLDSEQKFDFAFIDADKTNMLKYFTEAKRLLRKGGAIFVDNVVRDGRTADPADTSEYTVGVRKFIMAMKDDEEVEATTIGTVTGKGYDGFLYAVKK
ncbi:O-methyltransferase-domain-containing protein [Armillaria fumosa]|nr:O-methyltransferase-domain-containing protein [Armillaria fumosa]